MNPLGDDQRCYRIPAHFVCLPAATYYFQNGNPGACGDYNPDSALIVAMNHEQYAQGNCGKWVKITNTANGKTVTAKIAGELCFGFP